MPKEVEKSYISIKNLKNLILKIFLSMEELEVQETYLSILDLAEILKINCLIEKILTTRLESLLKVFVRTERI